MDRSKKMKKKLRPVATDDKSPVQEPKPKPAKVEEPKKEQPKKADRSAWKVALKVALFKNPKLTNDDLAELVIKDGFPSRASVDYARAETVHTMTVLKDE